MSNHFFQQHYSTTLSITKKDAPEIRAAEYAESEAECNAFIMPCKPGNCRWPSTADNSPKNHGLIGRRQKLLGCALPILSGLFRGD
jgi:hypothetical protein